MKAETFLSLLEKLGIQNSFSRPRVSNDNTNSESMFRTLKYAQIIRIKVLHQLQKQDNRSSICSMV